MAGNMNIQHIVQLDPFLLRQTNTVLQPRLCVGALMGVNLGLGTV